MINGTVGSNIVLVRFDKKSLFRVSKNVDSISRAV